MWFSWYTFPSSRVQISGLKLIGFPLICYHGRWFIVQHNGVLLVDHLEADIMWWQKNSGNWRETVEFHGIRGKILLFTIFTEYHRQTLTIMVAVHKMVALQLCYEIIFKPLKKKFSCNSHYNFQLQGYITILRKKVRILSLYLMILISLIRIEIFLKYIFVIFVTFCHQVGSAHKPCHSCLQTS